MSNNVIIALAAVGIGYFLFKGNKNQNTPATGTAGLDGVGSRKRKTYAQKKIRKLSLKGIDLGGVSMK